MKSLCLLPLVLLAACEVPRPMDGWSPDGSVSGKNNGGPGKDVGGGDEDGNIDEDADAGAAPSVDARVMVPRPEAGEGGNAGGGASGLAALEGRYLMRMDMYSTAKLPFSITMKNRVSNLLLVDFALKNGKLVGTETLCAQTYAHTCSASGCTMTTQVIAPVLERLASKPVQTTREYTFDEATGELSGLPATMTLGFDENPKTKAVPADKADARLWKSSEGLGFCTKFDVKHPLMKVSCTVGSVLRFKKKLSGKLDKAEPALTEDIEFVLEEAGSEGDALEAIGTPASQCSLDSLAGQAAGQGEPTGMAREIVRFKRLGDDVTSCPSDFDAQLPPDAP